MSCRNEKRAGCTHAINIKRVIMYIINTYVYSYSVVVLIYAHVSYHHCLYSEGRNFNVPPKSSWALKTPSAFTLTLDRFDHLATMLPLAILFNHVQTKLTIFLFKSGQFGRILTNFDLATQILIFFKAENWIFMTWITRIHSFDLKNQNFDTFFT